MIVCKVCSKENDDFSIKCSSCGSFIQDRIPNLDLFSTIWLVIESPADAFKRIILAEHKNFTLFLAFFLGIASVFSLFWFRNSGNNFDNILPLIILGFFVGIVIALPLFFTIVYSSHLLLKIFGGRGNLKNMYAVAGWSLVPIMLSVVIILPIELATLGLIFFAQNPNPYEVKPEVYSILIGLDAVAILWTMVLAARGTSIVHQKSFLFALVVIVIIVAAAFYGLNIIFSLFNI